MSSKHMERFGSTVEIRHFGSTSELDFAEGREEV